MKVCDARCTSEINSRFFMVKAAFKKKKKRKAVSFHPQMCLTFEEETSTVILWNTALCGAER